MIYHKKQQNNVSFKKGSSIMQKTHFKFLFFLPIFYCFQIISSDGQRVSLTEYLQTKNNIIVSQIPKNITIKNSIKRVVIVCPAYLKSGGPENLCQIYAALQTLNFEIYVLWVDNTDNVFKEYKDGVWYLCHQDINLATDIYVQNYGVNYLSCDVPLDEKTFVIVPEIWSDYIYFFENAKKGISWLSIGYINVDRCAEILLPLIEQKKLDHLDCVHLSQAPWIQKVLHYWGAKSFLLGDYISRPYFSGSKTHKSPNSIAYFPRKGGNLAAKFIEQYPDFYFIRLEKLNQLGMLWALDSARIYIDFGDFPGKDRIPREAILRNCIIFIHNKGCATDVESFPIDNYFRFTEEDILDGTLYTKIKHALHHYDEILQRQFFMKGQIFQEFDVFENNIQQCFGIPAI